MKPDPRPWQEREYLHQEKMWRSHRYTSVQMARARRLWRFWHRDQSRWAVLTPKGRMCFGPTTRRDAEDHALRLYRSNPRAGGVMVFEVYG